MEPVTGKSVSDKGGGVKVLRGVSVVTVMGGGGVVTNTAGSVTGTFGTILNGSEQETTENDIKNRAATSLKLIDLAFIRPSLN
jgi:hypothetical protein